MKPEEYMEKLRGPYMHLSTSYKPDNVWEVDHVAMRSNLRHMIEYGAKVVDATGTAGEWGYLTDDERRECWKDLVAEGKGKILCLAGNGHPSTKKAIEEARAAEKIGVDGFMTCGPVYHTPDKEGVYQHFKKIAESSSLGILVYNSSVLTHRANITPDIMERLIEIPNIIGIKESCYDMDQWWEQIRLMEKHNKVVVSGMGEMYFLVGALLSDVVRGCTSATATWDPIGPLELYDAVQERDWKGIYDSFRKSDVIRNFTIRAARGRQNINTMKIALDIVEGTTGATVRPPTVPAPLTEAELAELKVILKGLGLKIKK